MCDSMVVLPDVTKERDLIFAKNSDRPAGEIQDAVRISPRTYSNNLSIRNAGTIRHPEVVEYAVDRGLCKSAEDSDFARIFSSSFLSDVPSSNSREGRVRQLCQSNRGKFSVETAKSILRDHRGNVCMHREFVSAGSQISASFCNSSSLTVQGKA